MNFELTTFIGVLLLILLDHFIARLFPKIYYRPCLGIYSFHPFVKQYPLNLNELLNNQDAFDPFTLKQISSKYICVFEKANYHGITYPQLLHVTIVQNNSKCYHLLVQLNISSIAVIALFFMPWISLLLKVGFGVIVALSLLLQAHRFSILNTTLRTMMKNS